MAGIYVHIPFCHAKCAYCDFFSTPRMDLAEAVTDGIVGEFRARQGELQGRKADTVYFGGGTPSCLPLPLLQRITDALPLEDASEITIEVNPEDVSTESAALWRRLGFNRVSMGVQSLVDDELKAVGRRHSARKALSAVSVLRGAGFENISCDLIYGLPGQSLISWECSLRRLLEENIEHLSAYSLSYEPGTRLTAMLSAGKIQAIEDDLVADMYGYLCETARMYGFEHYEISNFAKPGFRSRHNSSYWTNTPYLGLGPGAHSMDATGTRRAAPPSVKKWLEFGAQIEPETAIDRINDTIITGLRTSEGLSLDFMTDKRLRDCVLRQASDHIARGGIIETHGRLIIPEHKWLVSDAIMRDLLIDDNY
ncbi:MAG: radical SAM family heme chaperone HemW [Muribaculaceae bacterium]|nr:radical SAM family heme chaperone HemW [Muribaculaceae bacterium]